MAHISVTAAMHRGQKRQAEEEIAEHYKRALARSPIPKGRKPWFTKVMNTILSEPNQVVIDMAVAGDTVKSTTATILSVNLADRKWVVNLTMVRPKNFDVTSTRIPLTISSHLIERIMQRKSMDRALDAVEYMAPTIGIAMHLFKSTVDEIFLPCGPDEGAIIMHWHKDLPNWRVMTTYIAPHQLSYTQKQVLKSVYEKAEALRVEFVISKGDQ